MLKATEWEQIPEIKEQANQLWDLLYNKASQSPRDWPAGYTYRGNGLQQVEADQVDAINFVYRMLLNEEFRAEILDTINQLNDTRERYRLIELIKDPSQTVTAADYGSYSKLL